MLVISWARFYQQFKADLKLWCYFILFQQTCRLCFIYILSNYIAAETKYLSILQVMLHGLRFDSLWATVWLFVPLIFVTLPSLLFQFRHTNNSKISKLRQYWGGIFTITTTLIYIISIEYFREYKDIFNQFLFGFFYDDKTAVLKTILAEHHVFLNSMILGLALILYIKFFRNFLAIKTPHTPNHFIDKTIDYSWLQKIIITCCVLLFYVIGFRGSIGPRPIQLKDAGVTIDPFLNKAIVSPYSALRYAIKEHFFIHDQESCRYGSNLQQDITTLAKDFFNKDTEYSALSKYMEKTANGSLLHTPKHVFLIIGESLDSWPLKKAYSKFNLTPNLQKLINEGLYLKYFLPCANGTMATLNTIITGLPDVELRTNYQQNSYHAYPTALAAQFKNLGFKSQFFYGGYLSWQRLEDFAHAQGFDAVYGAAHISNWDQTNEWGVDDRTLFNFIANTIQAATTPTFNVIMTTSNHPPFSINLKQEGFDDTMVAKLLAQYPNTETNVKELGHIWYADKAIGEFITHITSKDETALFAITGDHFGRKHILPNPPLFDISAVPFILYGNNIQEYYKFPPAAAGSHLDLGATLIELIAPQGFHYHAMGENLFAPENCTLGIGQQKIITSNFVASTTSAEIMYLRKHKQTISPGQLEALRQKHNQAMGIAWWLIKKGDLL